jgi:hypothetical protein
MANRKATFAKRQRETALQERARAKDARRAQLRSEVSETKGPQIAWDEAVHANSSSELPSLSMANEGRGVAGRPKVPPVEPPVEPEGDSAGPPVTSPDPAAPR